MPIQLDIAKEALAQIGTRSKIASLTDGSAEAQYVNLLYGPIRDFLLAEGDYDFAMLSASPALSGSAPTPWIYSYAYPANALRIRQVVPASYAALDPKPIAWNIFNQSSAKFILTRETVAQVLYTAPVPEVLWEPMFGQSFVRLLASALAFALENRIEASKQKMEEALSFAGIANLRDA
jgi:hypothetical protein